MDQYDLDVFYKHSLKNEYYVMRGSMFEMDTHKNVMIMSPENITFGVL